MQSRFEQIYSGDLFRSEGAPPVFDQDLEALAQSQQERTFYPLVPVEPFRSLPPLLNALYPPQSLAGDFGPPQQSPLLDWGSRGQLSSAADSAHVARSLASLSLGSPSAGLVQEAARSLAIDEAAIADALARYQNRTGSFQYKQQVEEQEEEPLGSMEQAYEDAAVSLNVDDERDSLAQALSELALQPKKDQYPVDIVLVPEEGLTLRNAALARLQEFLPPGSSLPEQVFDPHYAALLNQLAVSDSDTSLGPRPRPRSPSEIAAIAPTLAGYVPVGELPQYDISINHPVFEIVDVNSVISTGTAQGTVYDVNVRIGNTQLQSAATQAASEIFAQESPQRRQERLAAQAGLTRGSHMALVRAQPDGTVVGVHAALKKSPIYDPGLWLAYNALKRLLQYRNDNPYGIPDAATQRWFSEANALITAAHGPRLSTDILRASAQDLAARVAQVEQRLNASYNNVNNDAYVDAAGAFLASEIAVAGLSSFFPYLYGTLRALDTSYFDANTVAVLGEEVNQGFPVQATILQYIDGTLADLIDSGFFGSTATGIDYKRVMSMAAQVVFGLDAAQGIFGIVHNDFHTGNLAYVNVPPDARLYYMTEAGIYYAVPADKRFVMIDEGRSYFELRVKGRNPNDPADILITRILDGFSAVPGSISADRSLILGSFSQQPSGPYGEDAQEYETLPPRHYTWGSPTQRDVTRSDWNLLGRNNDLIRFLTTFLLSMNISGPDPNLARRDPSHDLFWQFASHALRCDGPNNGDFPTDVRGPFFWRSECRNLSDADERRECEFDMITLTPYETGSPCVNAVPADNVHWFDSAFRIDESEIPPDAHIYLIPNAR